MRVNDPPLISQKTLKVRTGFLFDAKITMEVLFLKSICHNLPLLYIQVSKVQYPKNVGIGFTSHHGQPMLETKAIKTKFGKRTFSYTGPKLWNALPLDI